MGIAIMPEGHQVLGGLTTLDNLRAAASMLSRSERDREIERALTLFPELKERLSVTGRSLSGGQKQMLAISQALVARPKFLLIDELSFGLAPTVVKRLTGAIEKIAADGVGILLIEQFTTLALAMSRQSHVLERGRLVFSGSSRELQRHPEILHSAYFPT
jgi:branched-chain amino acid transport system ATP-binding protein